MSDTNPISYVRETMLDQQEPPVTERGAIKWLRENLFSGWLNSLLTVASLGVIWFLIIEIGPWLMNTVWNAESLRQCREVLDGSSGACFAVIKDRWHQLLFGFYPREHYWRPVLALVLMLVALAPILFAELPRKMLFFSALFPFIGYHLLWGGSIWFPISILLGFVAGYVAFRLVVKVSSLVGVIAAVAGTLLWWVFLAGPFDAALYSVAPIGLEFVRSDSFGGFLISIVIGVSGISLSLPLGILLALGRQSDMIFVKSVCVVFIEFIRGVPLITLLFTASLLLNYFLPPGTSFDLILRVVIMVTLFAAAYMAEVIPRWSGRLAQGPV